MDMSNCRKSLEMSWIFSGSLGLPFPGIFQAFIIWNEKKLYLTDDGPIKSEKRHESGVQERDARASESNKDDNNEPANGDASPRSGGER